MSPRSRLHVPSPPARPGQEPDFSYVQISPAGAVARPDVMASAREIEDLSVQMVRVLGDDNRAVGPWNPHLEPEELQVGLRHMLLTRLFDDRMQKIQRQGRISFYIKSTGEEAVAVAAGHGAARPGTCCSPPTVSRGCTWCAGATWWTSCASASRTPTTCARAGRCPSCTTGAAATSSRSRATSPPSSRRRWAGRWRRPSRARTVSPPAGSARARAPRRTSTTP